jgi:secreted trypsin-like serine protease
LARWLPRSIIVSRTRVLTVLGASLLLASCGGEAEFGSRQQAIVNGKDDAADLNVGLLHSGGINACTATLIGVRTLLTAAHCVAQAAAPHDLITPLFFYPDGFTGRRISATAVTVHPDFAGPNQADLAVVNLSESLGLDPAQIASVAPIPGEPVTLLGFGKTAETSTDVGIRRVAATVIYNIDQQTIRYSGSADQAGNLCNGDSGGPTFATRDGRLHLIGVHSSKGGSCGQRGTDMRVDAFADWILQAMEDDSAVSAGVAPQVGCSMGGAEEPPGGGTLLLLLLVGVFCVGRAAFRYAGL